MKETQSTCPYCGVGCGVIIESQGAQITGVRGDPHHPANFGRLCTKGSTLHRTATAEVTLQTRLLSPLQRKSRNTKPQPIDWDSALTQAADKFAQVIKDHGPDAAGFYLSGQLLTEDYYVFNKLVKGLIGTNNLDTNSRLCMSSAVAGYKQTLGADAPPACYEDLALADCLFITGSNAAWAHPILFRRIEDARAARPQMKMVVVDPRRTDTAAVADLHLQIQPGTDVLLYHGMLHLMLDQGWTDPAYIAAHTSGFEALRELVREATPITVAETCGIAQADLVEATRLFARSPATLSLYCQGLNQSASGTAKNTALIDLHLATGQIGKPGAGPFSLTGQPNAMGGREVGGMANLLSAHRDLGNAVHRAEVAALWGVPDVPATPGKTAIEMFQAAADGQIKALWIACTNPAQSLPDQATVRRALERAEFVVVQEAFATTATCAFADLLLPATTWGEKAGTVTNSERRISRVRAAVPAAGQARDDWRIGRDFAQRLAARLHRESPSFDYPTPESVWNEHRESTRGRDLDITGLSYDQLDQAPQQWPFPEGARSGRARLYEDGRFPTPDGRARFAAVPYRALAEPCDAHYPFALNTGRLRDQWHGMSRTGTLGRLFGHAAEPTVQLHPTDMARLQLAPGALVQLQSRRGSVLLPAHASPDVAPAQAFVAMHWGGEYLSGRAADGSPLAGVNALTQPLYCPDSRQPELKHAAIRIEPAVFAWQMVALAWLPAEQVLAVREALRGLMPEFDFASCVPFASDTPLAQAAEERSGVLLRAASRQRPSEALLDRIEALLGLDAPDVMRYADPHRGQHRAVRLQRDGEEARMQAFLLGGDIRAEAWMKPLLQQQLPAQAFGRLLLSGSAAAPLAMVSRGPLVCSCIGVPAAAIDEHLAEHACAAADEQAALRGLQQSLRCGTSCGSCVPELRRRVQAARLIVLQPA
ncbi:molybdopterin-dependent oxidoreductase [Xylophilus rhododendri]|uniref:Molybdopterin-dependent oxidoreductase n=1 Tax=Xylophilus rhododendri TaxID=2697032 RepID=A0A857JDX0_9BURK|nr:nitrate reductase [Xylophilus rhododendri]QHJ01153.1 molybdopterin-dependent oxidoreductase [Xylophilus rhododendri]